MRIENKFLPTVRTDFLELENPKLYFQVKRRINNFAEGLDCYVKFQDESKKCQLIIHSNVFKAEGNKRADHIVEQDRFFAVQKVKEKILEFMNESNFNNSQSFMKILDEDTRAQCKLDSARRVPDLRLLHREPVSAFLQALLLRRLSSRTCARVQSKF